MLTTLRLKNFAVVEETEVAFGGGLTVLTGETGAGKSIVIDALGLLVGGRAEADVIRTGADEAVIEGVFERTGELAERLEALGLPDDGAEVSVRRAFSRAGRARVHVNGALVTVGVLQRLMHGQVDIAGQHEHMALLDAGQHLALVDRFGGVPGSAPRRAFDEAWGRVRDAEARLEALGGDDAQLAARVDYLEFQLDELSRLAPQPGEDEALELERRRLASSERLRLSFTEAEELLSSRDGAVSELLGRALSLVCDAEKVDPGVAKVRAALFGAQAEVDEAARALSRAAGGLDGDPRRLAEVEERLDALKRLCRKHAAPLEAVIARQASLAAELAELGQRTERREAALRDRSAALEAATRAAQGITTLRKQAGKRLSATVVDGLRRLAMGSARFEVRLEPAPLSGSGADQLQVLFGANAGEAPRPLAKVASGGEASRIMLALKAALAGSDAAVCSVFDEADAGIGGAVADVVGRLIKDISAHRQVLCITHLPQVAAHADAHLRIEKAEARGRTRSVVQVLDRPQLRAQELARMLSGVEVTREALSAAEALLRSAVRHVKPKRSRPDPDAAQRRTA